MEELCAVAEKSGINKNDFLKQFNGNEAKKALELDLERKRSELRKRDEELEKKLEQLRSAA